MSWLDRIPWLVVVAAALTLGLAPYAPRPHVVEKLELLLAGNLKRPIDVLDLILHGTPWALLVLKGLRAVLSRGG